MNKRAIKNGLSLLHKLLSQLRQVGILVFRKSRMPATVFIILMAIIFTAFRALTPWIKQYKGDVEQHLTVLLGQPVAIESLKTSWYWFEPVLKMQQVTVSDQDTHILQLTEVFVGINLLSSLWHWELKPGVLYIDGVHVVLRQRDAQWEIDGINPNRQHPVAVNDATYHDALQWILSQERMILKHIAVDLYFNDGQQAKLRNIQMTSAHVFSHYRFNGQATLLQKIPTTVSVRADVQLDPGAPMQLSGQVYLALDNVQPVQWARFLPKTVYTIQHGLGNAQIWMDVDRGALKSVQSHLTLQKLKWTDTLHHQKYTLDALTGNLSWRQKTDGWRVNADHVTLQTQGVVWPENAFSLNYQRTDDRYKAFIKELVIESVLASPMVLPAKLEPLRAMHLTGQLHNTQFTLAHGTLESILAQCTDLSWHAFKQIPGVQHLRGVLYWQPTEGRLELDGENIVITPHQLPPVTFGLLNMALDWKDLNQGFRMSLDRFVLSHPNLIVSARGAIDNRDATDPGNLRLTAEFAVKDGEKWIKYIPSAYLKPKLDQWLKQDIQRIQQANGRFTVNGPLADFPFDTKPGVFQIDSNLSGVDLWINKQWPLNRAIDATLHLDKRQLDVSISHANIQGAIVDNVSLAVEQIGSGHETLLIHGQADIPAGLVKKYLFNSPLATRFSRWKKWHIQDAIGLDLRLEVPLYPESDHVLARGRVTFDHNGISFKTDKNPLSLEHITGDLNFSEYGVTDGDLQGTLAGEPVSMHAQWVPDQKPYTEITLLGRIALDRLKQSFDFPILTVLDGHVNAQGILIVHEDPNQSDILHLQSSMEGATVHLPAPFNKSAIESTLFALDVDFNPGDTRNLKLWYGNQLSGNIFIKLLNGAWAMTRGQIRLGPGHVVLPKESGIAIVGSLPILNTDAWRKAWTQLPTDLANTPFINQIHHIDLTVDKLILADKTYPALTIHVAPVTPEDWFIRINQAQMAADLHYQPNRHLISGRINRLFMHQYALPKHAKSSTLSHFKPSSIPNLDITIDAFQWGGIDVGAVTLKSTSTRTQWTLDNCLITVPEYQLNVTGHWTLTDTKNETQLESTLHIKALNKALTRWQIAPAVDAKEVRANMVSAWPGSVRDFNYDALNGELKLVVQNGRIHEFDHDTEKKLGLGKLLSILSLQTIPRRLTLDFSDLSQKGYTFDVFKGDFKINHGVMHTQNSYIDGPVAYASMQGNLDLSKRLYDLDLRVSPYITASLPIVATIAGGPIAGIATWVASKIINKGMQQISGYSYKISGPWSDPIVQQISIEKR